MSRGDSLSSLMKPHFSFVTPHLPDFHHLSDFIMKLQLSSTIFFSSERHTVEQHESWINILKVDTKSATA